MCNEAEGACAQKILFKHALHAALSLDSAYKSENTSAALILINCTMTEKCHVCVCVCVHIIVIHAWRWLLLPRRDSSIILNHAWLRHLSKFHYKELNNGCSEEKVF
jgi:hypothetical protein